MVYKYYFNLKLIGPLLLLGTEDETKKEKHDRYVQHHILNIRALLLDTTDISTAIVNVRDFQEAGAYYLDSLKDRKKSVYYHKLACDLMLAFYHKFSDNWKVVYGMITSYGEYALSYLYAGMPDSAIAVARECKKVRDGNGMADLCILEAYLVKNDCESAVRLYALKKDSLVRPDAGPYSGTLREWLPSRLQKLKERGQGTVALDKFVAYMRELEARNKQQR
jgi:hypothetical protein